ncbi:hypothetical protein GGX14DRAFT_476586 [Mycena pura]|uniref:Glycosyltransferase family 1 protein n=1 Tax=Mycena pura TaxID=153505 RepID=A0AAD6UT37_9AGAR|nr:hypothetical protein GGX14DRAFT_476586 [Mycena pura]
MATHHIVAMLAPAWGHTVSYLHLAVQMLNKDSTLVMTIFQHNKVVAQMEKELLTCAYDKTRLRILGVGEEDVPFGPTMLLTTLKQLTDGWAEAIPRLAQGGEGWPRPHAIHFDFLCGGQVIEATKAIVGPDCKTLLWFCSATASMIAHFNEYDLAAIAKEIYEDEARRDGRTMDEILPQVAGTWNGSDKLSGIVVKNPGVPDIYDYERVAYAAGPPGILFSQIFVPAQKLAKHVDGYIITSASYLEPIGVPYCRAYYKGRGQELFAIGMQTHESDFSEAVHAAAPSNKLISSFLEDALRQYGPNSVLYISFGSLFFPVATPHLVEAFVNTLLDLETPLPFIFTLGSQMASLPKELVERVNKSGRGLVCDFWVEQRAILQHAALGWFLTHGGYNSVTESLVQGIPLIIWPAGAEQPINAALLSAEPNPVAIELMQIRTGPQIGPSLRGGPKITGTVEDASKEFKAVFEAMRSVRGEILRANAVKMAKAMREGRAGEASEEIIRLARF